MKKFFAALFCVSLAVTPVAAAFDIGAFGGYSSADVKVDNPGVFAGSTFRGAHFGASGHYLYSVAPWLSVGGGLYVSFAPNMAYSGEISSPNILYTNTGFSIGIEAQAKFSGLPFVSPYVKAGFGSEALRSLATYPGFSIESKIAGSGYRFLGGVDIPLFAQIFLYIEGGIIGAWYDVTVGSTSGGSARSTGYAANLGAGIAF